MSMNMDYVFNLSRNILKDQIYLVIEEKTSELGSSNDITQSFELIGEIKELHEELNQIGCELH